LETPPPQILKPLAASSKIPDRREKQTTSKRKANSFLIKLIMGWLVFITLIVVASQHLWRAQPQSPVPSIGTNAENAEDLASDRALVSEATPLCNQVLAGYLAARTPEQRNQFVLQPIVTAARMARYYAENSSTNIDPKNLKLTHSSIVHLPNGPALETHWSSSDGYEFDTVFMKEGDEWLLDWDHFVRYSDTPWPLFLAGSGEAAGEFRLLARERLADERKHEDAISIVLCAPRFGYSMETGFESPEFLVSRNTKNGRLLDAAFKLIREDKRVFGAKYPNNNPDGFIRLRVKIRRFEQDGERRFELLEVVACHWYSVTAPGVEISE